MKRMIFVQNILIVIFFFNVNSLYPQFQQQGERIFHSNSSRFGNSVSISSDGTTALIGGSASIWIFTKDNGIWSQPGYQIVDGTSTFGTSVSISNDGKTLVAGDPNVNKTYVYEKSNNEWELSSILSSPDSIGSPQQGTSVALSGDGNTIIIGGPFDNNNVGAAWIFVKNNGTWIQQGTKLVGTDPIGNAYQDYSVALSFDGNTAIIGRPFDNNLTGAIWFFAREDKSWIQQGNKILCDDYIGTPQFGSAVSLSADGNTALIGGRSDNNNSGAAWIFIRSKGNWSQRGTKLVGTEIGSSPFPRQGSSVSISADGNTAIIAGNTVIVNNGQSAAWLFTRTNDIWSSSSDKLVGDEYAGNVAGASVSISADGNTVILSSPFYNNSEGAAWIFSKPITEIFNYENSIPIFCSLFQNYPNPFNPTTKIEFILNHRTKVKMNIYNSLGQLIKTVLDKELFQGHHKIVFDGNNYPSGVYFYQLIADDYRNTKKFILMK